MIHRIRLLLLAVLIGLALPLTAQEPDSQSWYEVDALNAGLDAPPEGLNRASPRASMRAFVELADAGHFAAAQHLLNFNDIPPERQAVQGEIFARQLYQVIDRRVWLDWSGLPARPDALVEDGSSNNPQAGQTRRDLGIKLFQLNGRAYEIRLARYKAPGLDEAVWLFTPQTVEDVPALHDAYGPRAFERHIPDALQREIGALRLWEWIALPLLLGALIALGWTVKSVLDTASGRFSRPFLKTAFERASFPLALFMVALAAQAVLGLAVSFSGPVTAVVQPVLVVIMTSAVGIAILRVIDAVLDRITRRYVSEIDDASGVDKRELYTSIYALRRVIVLLMVGFATIFVLVQLNLFESLGITLLASAGVLTVLLGIAGQAVLGNILASLQIALAKPVRIGDSVLFEGHWAYVESIFYTFMRLRTWDERRIIVPVKYFVSNPFENWSVKDARMMKTVRLRLDHAADAEALRETFETVAKEEEGVIEHDTMCVFVTDHDAHGQEITFYVMTPDPSTGWEVEMRLREKLMAFIREEHPEWWPRERVTGGRHVPDGD
ncbi:mechanosensitive ion channel family protein [Marinovum sp.]|uniref:mechanosensitive ion channel family protein n=1 Tax=Marinovum sp. TaxID=2024839 RepID=UPI002B26BCD7|nr:mechanosensitive ion channel domain-containing protein [Marinovum sp.]